MAVDGSEIDLGQLARVDLPDAMPRPRSLAVIQSQLSDMPFPSFGAA